MEKLRREQLKSMLPCKDCFKWWIENCEGIETIEQLKKLNSEDCPDNDWANWLIVKIMSKKQCQAYAVYAACKVLYLYEKKYKDDAPRKAIQAAINVIKRDTEQNRSAAMSAAMSASWSAMSARSATKRDIVNYGIRILEGTEKPQDVEKYLK